MIVTGSCAEQLPAGYAKNLCHPASAFLIRLAQSDMAMAAASKQAAHVVVVDGELTNEQIDEVLERATARLHEKAKAKPKDQLSSQKYNLQSGDQWRRGQAGYPR